MSLRSSAWGMWVAVLCLLGAGALVLFASWMTAPAVGARHRRAPSSSSRRRALEPARGRLARSAARGMRHGASAAVLVLLALGVAVLANAVSLRYNARWDLTENKRHSLSPQTVKLLAELTAPIEAIALLPLRHAGQAARPRTCSSSTPRLLRRQVHLPHGGSRPLARPGQALRRRELRHASVMQSGDKSERRCSTPRRSG
mgnify:CR=1 FL=1